MKKVLICGGAGFIGHHFDGRLKSEGHYVVVADIKPYNEYCWSLASTFCRYLFEEKKVPNIL